jgi:hypothetical protein
LRAARVASVRVRDPETLRDPLLEPAFRGSRIFIPVIASMKTV